MRLFKTALFLASVMLPLAIGVHGQNPDPWNFPDFSATQVFETAKYDIPMRVFRLGSSVRLERSAAIATLYVLATNKVYNLTRYPDGSRQCVVMTPDQAKMLPSPLELLNGLSVQRLSAGTELIEGHKCKVEIAKVTRADGRTIQSKVWEAQDLNGVPVKIESQLPEMKLTAVYREIVLRAPDRALFTPPDKCTPYEKMGQVVEKVTR